VHCCRELEALVFFLADLMIVRRGMFFDSNKRRHASKCAIRPILGTNFSTNRHVYMYVALGCKLMVEAFAARWHKQSVCSGRALCLCCLSKHFFGNNVAAFVDEPVVAVQLQWPALHKCQGIRSVPLCIIT